MHVLKHLHLMYFVFFFPFCFLMLHKNSGANVSPGACRHIMWYIHGGKKNIKVSTQVKKKTTNMDAKHSTCLLFRCIRGGSRVEETAVSSQYSVYINAASAHAANLMLFLG